LRNEWAHSADDILWRRSKLGLRLDDGERARLQALLHSLGVASVCIESVSSV
jgi:glycerol-3-phosphate dehydrogenase